MTQVSRAYSRACASAGLRNDGDLCPEQQHGGVQELDRDVALSGAVAALGGVEAWIDDLGLMGGVLDP